mgnify:CR=1 FL=1
MNKCLLFYTIIRISIIRNQSFIVSNRRHTMPLVFINTVSESHYQSEQYTRDYW